MKNYQKYLNDKLMNEAPSKTFNLDIKIPLVIRNKEVLVGGKQPVAKIDFVGEDIQIETLFKDKNIDEEVKFYLKDIYSEASSVEDFEDEYETTVEIEEYASQEVFYVRWGGIDITKSLPKEKRDEIWEIIDQRYYDDRIGY